MLRPWQVKRAIKLLNPTISWHIVIRLFSRVLWSLLSLLKILLTSARSDRNANLRQWQLKVFLSATRGTEQISFDNWIYILSWNPNHCQVCIYTRLPLQKLLQRIRGWSLVHLMTPAPPQKLFKSEQFLNVCNIGHSTVGGGGHGRWLVQVLVMQRIQVPASPNQSLCSDIEQDVHTTTAQHHCSFVMRSFLHFWGQSRLKSVVFAF